MITNRCESHTDVEEPDRTRYVRCDLEVGHDGPHQWGGMRMWIEWDDSEEIENVAREQAERDGPSGGSQ